jgi:hypothetical protein
VRVEQAGVGIQHNNAVCLSVRDSEVTWLSILLQDVVSSKASGCRLCCVLVIVAVEEQRCLDTGLIRDRSGRSEEACMRACCSPHKSSI